MEKSSGIEEPRWDPFEDDGIYTRAIQDWLRHVSITFTTRYAALSPTRFKDLWRD